MLPIPMSESEQKLCQVILLGTFPGANVLVRSTLAKREVYGDTLLVSGEPNTITRLMSALKHLRNRGEEGDYEWDVVRRIADMEIYLHLSSERFVPRITLVETIFRVDAARFANLCLSAAATLKVARPGGTILEVPNLGVPVDPNGEVLLVA